MDKEKKERIAEKQKCYDKQNANDFGSTVNGSCVYWKATHKTGSKLTFCLRMYQTNTEWPPIRVMGNSIIQSAITSSIWMYRLEPFFFIIFNSIKWSSLPSLAQEAFQGFFTLHHRKTWHIFFHLMENIPYFMTITQWKRSFFVHSLFTSPVECLMTEPMCRHEDGCVFCSLYEKWKYFKLK